MKKYFNIGLLLTACLLVACQEVASSSSEKSDSSIISSSNSGNISFESSDSSSKNNEYYPIGTSSTTIDLFSNDGSFSLSTPTITKEQAEDLVSNDLSSYPEEKSLHKKTVLTSVKQESHVKANYSSSNYSVKDLIEEKHTISQIDSDNKWSYSKSVETCKTVYFEEDTLIRHIARENLFFVKDGCYYQVTSEQSYYEGLENRGIYESYYYKMYDLKEEECIGRFTIYLDSWTYFNKSSGFDKIDKSIYNNFSQSSSFYYSNNYRDMERHPSYEYHSSKEGDFGCVAVDDYEYYSSDITDYPSGEKDSLYAISYHQDYLVNIFNYFTYNEDYLTKSISKKANDNVIREETRQGRKKVIEECEVFYPDLSKFEEREYNPITK